MIKRYLCCNCSLLTIQSDFGYTRTGAIPAVSGATDILNLHQSRQVFASSGTGGGAGGPDAEKAKLTLETLEEGLDALEEEGKLTKEAVTAAMKFIKSGGDTAKQKVLKLAQKVEDGSYKSDDFSARLPGAAKPEAGKSAEGKDGKAPDAKTQGPEAAKEEGKEKAESGPEGDEKGNTISRGIKRKTEEMLESADAMEKAYLKRETITPKEREEFNRIKQAFPVLNDMDKKNNDEEDAQVKAELAPLVAEGKLTKEEADLIVERDYLDSTFAQGRDVETYDRETKTVIKTREKGFTELTQSLTDEKSKTAVAKILGIKKAHAEKHRKLEADIRKLKHEYLLLMKRGHEAVMQVAAREKKLKEMTRSSGINVAPGQKLSYLQTDGAGNIISDVPKTATIKEVKFVDESAPFIILELENANGEMVEDIYAMPAFLRLVNTNCATEKIENLGDLGRSIGTEVKAGDAINYVQQLDGSENPTEQVLKIEKIDVGEKMMTLSDSVRLHPQGDPKRKLTFGEFAKWFKRMEGAKEIQSFNQLRDELRLFNDVQNTVYERKASIHPPIELKKDEIVKYPNPNDSDKKWTIKEMDDKHITLSDNRKFSPTGFLRWVKENEVEKFDPASEAAQGTEMSGNEEEKKRLQAEAEKEAADLIAKSHDPSAHHADSHEHADKPAGYFSKLWANTKFISPMGLWEMGKIIKELCGRKIKRSEQDRVGTVGSRMFGPIWAELGSEFKSKAQHAENEEVDHHLKHFRTMGYDTWIEELHHCPTKDILKAAITVMCEKGQMRWDDPGFWHGMNKYTFGALKNEDGTDLTVNKDNYMTAIEKYMDLWWGQDTFRELYNKQDSSYKSIKSGFTDLGKRLEGDPDKNGGLKFALQQMLHQHLQGEHVNAAKYESLLHFAIHDGKLGFEDKVFFLMMGAGMAPSGGQTLLHIDRVAAMEGELLNNFPILDYFTSPNTPQVDAGGNPIMNQKTGEQEMGRPDSNNFRKWIRDYIEKDLGMPATSVGDANDLKPGKNLIKFIRREAVWDDWVRTRLHKSAKTASNWDHDDMDVHAAFMTDSLVDQLVTKQGGATQSVSTPGLKNAMVGFADFMKIKMDMLEEHKAENNKAACEKDTMEIFNLLKSFMKLDAILDRRLYHDAPTAYARFSSEDWNSYAGADSGLLVRDHVSDSRKFIGTLCKAIDAKTGGSIFADWEVIRTKGSNPGDQKAKLEGFGEKFNNAMTIIEAKGGDQASVFMEAKGIIRGVADKDLTLSPAEKQKAAEKAASQYKFNKSDDRMEQKVKEYQELKRKIGETPTRTPEQVTADEGARLQQIISSYAAGNYSGNQEEDAPILQAAIDDLKNQLAIKKTGKPAEKETKPEKEGKPTKK